MSRNRESKGIPKAKLTRAEKQQLAKIMAQAKKSKYPQTAQQTIPYQRMWPDGICRVTDNYYTKTVRFFDINYQLAQNEDKEAIFNAWCDVLNYFSPNIKFQFSFVNTVASEAAFEQSVIIPPQGDGFDDVREEYTRMLLNQVSKGNNGLQRAKYLTFGIEAENVKTAKPRLEHIELDLLNHFKRLGVKADPMDGKERLRLMHAMFHMDDPQAEFMFDWKWLAPSGLSTKDFIAPSGLYFKDGRRFYMGGRLATVSYLQIFAAELDDRLLVELLGLETSQVVTMHVQSLDHVEAIKLVKSKISDLNRSKIDEQKKAVRSGYDIDILPSDLNTYTNDLTKVLQDLQNHNERMFMLTFLVMHTGSSRRELDNILLQAKGIVQENLCQLVPLDYQQEEGLMASMPLGYNPVEIKRSMTTSAAAIFIPFITQELFHDSKEALYYGLNASSNNLIMADRKLLKNPNGLILGTPGCFAGETRLVLSDGTTVSFAELIGKGVTEANVRAYDEESGQFVDAAAKDIRIEKYVDELQAIELQDGTVIRCTDAHLIMDAQGNFIPAKELFVGQRLSGGHTVERNDRMVLPEKIPVYDLTVPRYLNFVLENGLVVHNSGKSFSAKREIANAFLITNDDIIICDPEGEYYPIVQRLGGQVIRISPTSGDYINPLDLNLNYSDEEEPLRLKSDFVLSLCELVLGGRDGIGSQQKSIIDRALREIYRPFLSDPVPEKVPILGDLYNELRRMSEPEAAYVATALELYVDGSLNIFNHRTNVELNSRLVCFDIKQLGQQLKKLGMLIVQDQVWNRVTINRALQKTTRYYMDEFHLLLREPQTAAYSIEVWKRFRKWGGMPTGITQNVKDLLSSREVESIFENSEFVMMLNQAAGDRAELAKRLNISKYQLSHVTQSGEGEGLLYFGNVLIPFADHFPKDTELYRIMTTKPSEMLQEGECAS